MSAKHPKHAKPDPVEVKPDVETQAVEDVEAVEADASTAPKTIGVRGPKGADLNAKITLMVTVNPKREGSKAFDVFAQYVDGMTVQEFLDVAGSEATPNIVYDVKHGYIAVEGYNVEVLPPKEAKVKAVKQPKAPKVKAEKLAPAPKDEELARETVEEEA